MAKQRDYLGSTQDSSHRWVRAGGSFHYLWKTADRWRSPRSRALWEKRKRRRRIANASRSRNRRGA